MGERRAPSALNGSADTPVFSRTRVRELVPTAPHPIHRRYYAEDLVRLRRSSEKRRYAASQRLGRIDANPHQIDAVMFALRRIPEGGCILADEVGLGKTIEAGLVIAQLLAEGASRILIIVPRPLLGQWQDELYTLFGIVAQEAADQRCDVSGSGVFLVGREYAGSAKGSERLAASPPFELCVIDEAHEMFAGIYKRFDSHGIYDEAGRDAQTAHRVQKLIGPTPVLLLTATPLQNSLAELWGLLHYIEPTGTLLGSFPTFKTLFCEKTDGRRLVPEQGSELKRRLGVVVQRTLRRQAQDFLDKPFVGRRAKLYEYSMSSQEKKLYGRCHELSAVAQPVRLPGTLSTAAAAELPPSDGVVDGGTRQEPGAGRRPAAQDAVWRPNARGRGSCDRTTG